MYKYWVLLAVDRSRMTFRIITIDEHATPSLVPHLLPRAEEQPTVELWPTAGHALGVSRSTIYQAARRGQVPGLLRVGGRYRVAVAELRRALGLDVSEKRVDDDVAG